MRYSIRLTREAVEDLDDIFTYIARVLRSPETAAGQLDRLEKGIAALDELPERYPLFDREPWRSRGLRRLPIDSYLVFYLFDSEDGIVTVLRVLYGGRDIIKQLS